MPKLKNRLPKLCKNGNYAFVRYLGQKISLGRWGTPESKQAYARFITNLQNNPGDVPRPLSGATADNQGGLVSELVARYLDYVKSSGIDKSHYTHCHILLTDFVLPYYGDILADEFSPKCLKFVRDRMIESKRFCRRVINDYASRIISMFSYGIEEELCQHQTVATLREVRSLKEGAKGTFDHPPVEPVPDDVIRRTLPFLTPTLRAMVQLQWLFGFRPSELCKMRVGAIDKTSDPDCWVYDMSKHKTAEHISGRKIYLSEPAQKLIAPYLKGKKWDQFIFSPEESERERHGRQRAERKSPLTPSQTARDENRAAKPGITFSECYNKDSYRRAIQRTIKRANKTLSSDKQIEMWFPYQIRHSTATFVEETEGLDESQAVLGHTSADMTKRYAKAREKIQKRVALEQTNPFEETEEEALNPTQPDVIDVE